MLSYLTALLILLPIGQTKSQLSSQVLDPSCIISTSELVKKGVYLRPVPDNASAVTIHGSHLTIDFQKATIAGDRSVSAGLEDQVGVGLLVEGCNDVTIKNANVYGYRFNIVVRNSTHIKLLNCDASFSRTIAIAKQGVPINEFLDLRNLNAWKSYGSGVWLENSNNCLLSHVRACESQNGLLMIDSNYNSVSDCDFSFNSGWGIGLWSSSNNELTFDLADFCNRPWAGGWGGDSAGVALADSSNENLFYKDSFTHSGDGFFLTDSVNGGFSDIDKTFHFAGGCDSNKVIDCDGSYSTANAFESTFSQYNDYIDNKATNSQYGFWIGFSNNTLISGCQIVNNVHDGIAGGQGARNQIELNAVSGNGGDQIHFWSDGGAADAQKPAINEELFNNQITPTDGIVFSKATGTDYNADRQAIKTYGVTSLAAPAPDQTLVAEQALNFKSLVANLDASEPPGFIMYENGTGPKGVEWLRPGDYAPYDFRGHLFAVSQLDDSTMQFYLLRDGVELQVPGTLSFVNSTDPHLSVVRAMVPTSNIGGITNYRVTASDTHTKKSESYSGQLTACKWQQNWYRWDKPNLLAYTDISGWTNLFASKPLAHTVAYKLDADYSGRSPIPNVVPVTDFAMAATTKVKIPAGRLQFNTISDDGLRAYIDGQLVIDDWNHHGAKSDQSITPVDAGVHELKIEYCQEDGGAVLKVNWKVTN